MLLDEIKTLPKNPGVYEYFGSDGRLLYVGKAKNLKNRVRSYFSFSGELKPNPNLSPRISKMISEARHLEYIITSSESDALILENSFIKQLRPKYNILLRDDKTYPYIYLNLNDEFPRFDITRRVIKGANIRYFGPYFKGAREVLDALYMQFKLVQKSSCIKGKKSCIFYQMNRCHAPCEGKISAQKYRDIVDEAIKSVKNPELLLGNLEISMMKMAENFNYEEAAKIRDQMQNIREISVKVEVDMAKLEDFEVFAVAIESSFICSVRFSIRDGKIAGSNFNITNSHEATRQDISEIYKQAILESFPKDSPSEINKIYLYEEFEDMGVLEELISQIHGKKFSVKSPKIGEKRRIVDIAYENARINIQKHIKTHDYEFLDEIKRYFDLENLPINIEIFDNSHMFGSAPVGAMVCYKDGKFYKENYRHAHLNSNNDYDQMIEFLTLRASRFDKVSPPDLWVIDGGKALLDLAGDIMRSSGANFDIIAISKEKIDAKAHRSKGSANDKIWTKNGVFSLNSSDKKLQFFQKLRDEAHRFAISFHKKTKQKEDLESSKLLKMGISKANLKKLIDYYGNFENIYKASFDEIRALTNTATAQNLFKKY